VPDPRKKRGIRHDLPQILAIAVLATLRGATSLFAIGELARELPQEALGRLHARISPVTGCRVAPEESTIRRTLKAIDATALDTVVNAWIVAQVLSGRLGEDEAVEVDFKAMVDDDERENNDDHDAKGGFRKAVALDGKTLRGARLEEGRKVHLVSVVTHEEATTIAQANVDTKTNEITVFRPLLGSLDIQDVVVTADALHTQREHAKFLVSRGAHYVFGVKENQPTLLAHAQRSLEGHAVDYESHDRGHGRIEHRYVSVAPIAAKLAKKLGFPSARQFVSIYRERCDLTDHLESTERSYYVTDLPRVAASAEELGTHIRRHWTIENRSHYVRDRTFDEDRSQVRVGGAPQALATLRNLAISILRLVGFTNIASGLRSMAFDHRRAFALLGL
jgi:predicted transposase YbfD/YdcC